MAPGDTQSTLRALLRLLVSAGLFAGLMLAVFWTPGLVLGLFALAYAADSNALSQSVDRRRRLRQLRLAARAGRGGWTDSAAARP